MLIVDSLYCQVEPVCDSFMLQNSTLLLSSHSVYAMYPQSLEGYSFFVATPAFEVVHSIISSLILLVWGFRRLSSVSVTSYII